MLSSSAFISSTTLSTGKSGSTLVPLTSSTSAPASRGNVTSTGVPAGFTTSVTIVNGVTSSVLINPAGATTSFGAVANSVFPSSQKNGAGNLAAGFGGILAAVGVVAIMM